MTNQNDAAHAAHDVRPHAESPDQGAQSQPTCTLSAHTPALLELRGVSASVDEKAILRNVDLVVGAHETHVLMGPNGAGKSTLGHVVMGNPAYTLTAGSVIFDGRDITELSPDKRSRAGLFLSFQAPVEIPGVPLSTFLRATIAGREGFNMKGKQFKRHVQALAEELDFNPDYLDRELGVGFSGGEKKKLEMLQLLLLKPKLAILDETDSGLDVDALGVVSRGIDLYKRTCEGTLIIITHNTRILEHVSVDHVHVLVRGQIAGGGDASLIGDIDAHGFERFEQAQLAANARDADAGADAQASPATNAAPAAAPAVARGTDADATASL